MKYIHESVKKNGKNPQFTNDEVDQIVDFVRSRFTREEYSILHVYESITKEYARGQRCSVCGLTVEQSDAIGYDCIREC